jgi:hypothetical protein
MQITKLTGFVAPNTKLMREKCIWQANWATHYSWADSAGQIGFSKGHPELVEQKC